MIGLDNQDQWCIMILQGHSSFPAKAEAKRVKKLHAFHRMCFYGLTVTNLIGLSTYRGAYFSLRPRSVSLAVSMHGA